MSELNELRTINLRDEFGVAVNNYKISSPVDSEYLKLD